MNTIRIGLAFALALPLLGCEPQGSGQSSSPDAAQATPPSHDTVDAEHHHHGSHAMLRLDEGQPWGTDASLVLGMERIRDAVTETSAEPALGPDSAAALAQLVRDQVNFLIANCQLEPAADATLHVLIAQLLSAAAAMEADPASPEGLPQMRHTLLEYPRHFAHPDW